MCMGSIYLTCIYVLFIFFILCVCDRPFFFAPSENSPLYILYDLMGSLHNTEFLHEFIFISEYNSNQECMMV